MSCNDLTSNTEQTYPEFRPFDNSLIERWGLSDLPPPPEGPVPEKQAAPDIDTSTHKVEQDSLRYILGQLMLEADEQLGEIPENMGLAEREMRDAAKELGENEPALAIPLQPWS